MKKLVLFIFLFSFLTIFSCFAQGQNPNRILVNDKGGVTKGFVIDYLEDMSFARVDGEVLAKVTVDQIGLETLTLTIKRTPECSSFKLAILTQTVANQLGNDANAIRYINALPSSDVPELSEDFNRGTLSGISLNADSKYSIITVGIDKYGIESGVFRADFETPKPTIVGNPHIDMKVTESTLDSFTVEFTPNKDVNTYWVLAGEEGTLERDYEQFASMFGFTNMSDMIRMWGVPTYNKSEHTWSEMAPNTTYDVYVALTDANGNFAPFESTKASTLSMGGHGDAEVKIELLGIEATDWNGQMLPTQVIKFTPNDQASCYRYALYTKSEYDAKKDEIQKDLCSDPDQNYANWFQYFEGEAEYAVDLNTDYVAIAAAKNIDKKWGKVNELRFKTPATCSGYNDAPAAKAPVAKKQVRNAATKAGVAPVLNRTARQITIK